MGVFLPPAATGVSGSSERNSSFLWAVQRTGDQVPDGFSRNLGRGHPNRGQEPPVAVMGSTLTSFATDDVWLPEAIRPRLPSTSVRSTLARAAILLLLAGAIFAVDTRLASAVELGVAYVALVVLAMWLPGDRPPVYVAVASAIMTLLAHAVSPSGNEGAASLWSCVLTGIVLLTTGALCTCRKRSLLAVAALCDRSELFASIARHFRAPVVVYDSRARVRFWNRSAERLYGFAKPESCSMTAAALFPEDERSNASRAFERVLQTREPTTLETARVGKQRSRIDVEMTVLPLLGQEGNILGVATIDRDLEPDRQFSYATHKLAYFDSLTALPNRRLFNEKLEGALERAARHDRLAALLFFDLDGFKQVNDALGHSAGDRLLCVVSERLMASVRRVDYVGQRAQDACDTVISRLGGDEFTVILSEISSASDAARVTKRMLDAIQRPINLLDQQVSISASAGVAIYPFDGQDAATLVRNADTAMHGAKMLGPGMCALYSEEMNRELKRKLEVTSCLRAALDEDRFELHFQPVCGTSDERVVGAEALVRLNDPELGAISPAEFIPIAEDSGLIVPLGQWVLRRACAAAAAWQRHLPQPIWVAVNLSAHQARLDDLAELIPAVLSESGLSPELLELEITESAVLGTERNAARVLETLRASGIRIIIDDFGTGYSSLSRLRDLPLDGLKIDRSFLSEVNEEERGGAFAELIIAMARTLGVKVVAEGVETEEQLRFLRARQCDQVQGFLLGRPVPEEQFVSLWVRGCDPPTKKPEVEE